MFQHRTLIVLLIVFAANLKADSSFPELSKDELEQLKMVHFVSMVSKNFISTYEQANSKTPAFRDMFVNNASKKTEQFYKFQYSETYKDELNEGYWDFLENLNSCSYLESKLDGSKFVGGQIDAENCSISYERKHDKDDRNIYDTKLVLNYESDRKLIHSIECKHRYNRAETNATTNSSCNIDSLKYGKIEHLRETKDESEGIEIFAIWVTHTINYNGKGFEYKYLSKSADLAKGVKSDVFLNGRDVTANKHIRSLDQVEQMTASFSAKKLWPKMLMQPYGF